MLLLGVDTSGHHGSLALARGVAESFAVLDVVPLPAGNYSSQFIPELSALLARHSLGKHDLEGFAVVSGPGSFTGLRVGLAAIKGLAEIIPRPIAAVSMLEALAAQALTGGRVIAAFDAGRKQLYVGEYDLAGDTPTMVSEALLTQVRFSDLLAENPQAELVTTDMAIAELAPLHLYIKHIAWPDAGEVARLGFYKIRAGQTVAPDLLEANYIRRSDAEIFSQPAAKL